MAPLQPQKIEKRRKRRVTDGARTSSRMIVLHCETDIHCHIRENDDYLDEDDDDRDDDENYDYTEDEESDFSEDEDYSYDEDEQCDNIEDEKYDNSEDDSEEFSDQLVPKMKGLAMWSIPE